MTHLDNNLLLSSKKKLFFQTMTICGRKINAYFQEKGVNLKGNMALLYDIRKNKNYLL